MNTHQPEVNIRRHLVNGLRSESVGRTLPHYYKLKITKLVYGHRRFGHKPNGHSQLVTVIWTQPFGHNHLVTIIWAQPAGHSNLVTTIWSQPTGQSYLLTTIWSQPFGHSQLFRVIWSQLFVHSNLVTTSWSQRTGHSHLVTKIGHSHLVLDTYVNYSTALTLLHCILWHEFSHYFDPYSNEPCFLQPTGLIGEKAMGNRLPSRGILLDIYFCVNE